MAGAVKIYVEGPHGPQVFDADSEAPDYESDLYGKVRPELLVFLDSEVHVYGRAEDAGDAPARYDIGLEGGVLSISSGGGLIRAYGPGFWQQIYRHPSRR